MSLIDDQLNQLKVAREAAENYRATMREIMDAVKRSGEYMTAADRAEKANIAIAETEERIKTMALREYETSQNKHPHEKVEIKTFKTFKITDAARVLSWVKTNLADALIYDESKVKQYATKIGAVEGTETGEEQRVQIASKL